MAIGHKKLIILLVLSVFILSTAASAQVSPAQSTADQQAQLQQQLLQIEQQIQQYQQQLTQIQGQKNTLQNKIKQLQIQQNKLKLQIEQTNLSIQDISGQMNETQNLIDVNSQHISALKNEMASLVEATYEQDQSSFVVGLLAQGSLSDFYTQIYDYQIINENLSVLASQIQSQNQDLQSQEQKLSDQKQQQQNLVAIVGLQSDQLSQSISGQNDLLKQTKGQESDYQIVISDTQKQADAIRSRIYQLLGVTSQITFGDAYKIAQWASGASGVRPAFLLAILTQESNLGKNVGTCNRPGDPASKSYKVVMNPTRDIPPFLQITAALGVDPDITPVSCPMKDKNGKQIGWGGAMGPAQFIPSTWVGYKDKVAAITGKASNPWDIRDAFLAAALKLAAGGATSQNGEWAAAMRYFSGGTNPAYSFYGDSVVALATQYQNDIDQLGK